MQTLWGLGRHLLYSMEFPGLWAIETCKNSPGITDTLRDCAAAQSPKSFNVPPCARCYAE